MRAKPAVLLVAAWLAASPVFAATFTETADDNAVAEMEAAPAGNLIDTLSHDLNVSNEQAIGGAGALLGLAMNSLQERDSAQLQKTVPGLDQLTGSGALGNLGNLGGLGNLLGGTGGASALLGGVNNLQDVNQLFGVLGMDQSMVPQFAGALLNYFVQQGLNSQLIGTLRGLWGTPGTPVAPLVQPPAVPVSGLGA